MFKKIVLSTIAALCLTAGIVAPTQASPHNAHHPTYRHENFRHDHYRPYLHREFCSWAEANNWIRFQRSHGFECYFEWHGPNCWVFYR